MGRRNQPQLEGPGSCEPPRPPSVQQRRGECRAQGLHAEEEIKVIPCKPSEEPRVRSPAAAGPGASIRRNPMLSPAGRGRSGSAPGQHHGPLGCTPRSRRAPYTPLSPLCVVQPACDPLPPPPGTAWYLPPCHLLLQAMQAAPHWHPSPWAGGTGCEKPNLPRSLPLLHSPRMLRVPCTASPVPTTVLNLHQPQMMWGAGADLQTGKSFRSRRKQGRSPLNPLLHLQLGAGSIYQLIPRERP